MKLKVVVLVVLGVFLLAPLAEISAKGSSGGRSSSRSSSRSSTTKSSTTKNTTSKSTTSKPTPPKSNARKTSSSNVKPGSTIKTSDGKTIKTSTVKPKDGKYNQEAGVTGVDGYTPRFTNNYSAPPGSIVYYRDTSFIDYLPWIYLFSQNNPATPAGQSATVVQPDGKQVQAKPQPEGTDGLAILNWIILVLLLGGLIVLIVWLVNKYTTKEKLSATF